MAFNIEAFGKDDAPVIDVTRLFASEVPEFSARTRIGARGFDASRSFSKRAVALPQNVEVEATHTFTSPPEAAAIPTGGRPGAGGPPSMRPGSATVLMHYSMVKLPEKTDAVQTLRQPRRIFYCQPDGLQFGRAEGSASSADHAVETGKEGS